MFSQGRTHLAKDTRRVFVRWLSQPIVHPFPLAPRRDDAGAPQVSQMARNLRLAAFQNSYEKTDANFGIANQANQPQTSAVSQGFEKYFDVVTLSAHLLLNSN